MYQAMHGWGRPYSSARRGSLFNSSDRSTDSDVMPRVQFGRPRSPPVTYSDRGRPFTVHTPAERTPCSRQRSMQTRRVTSEHLPRERQGIPVCDRAPQRTGTALLAPSARDRHDPNRLSPNVLAHPPDAVKRAERVIQCRYWSNLREFPLRGKHRLRNTGHGDSETLPLQHPVRGNGETGKLPLAWGFPRFHVSMFPAARVFRHRPSARPPREGNRTPSADRLFADHAPKGSVHQ